MDKKTELLMKIKALADTGTGGEKLNAKRKLEQFMRRYGIKDEDLCDEVAEDREFAYSGEREKRLLAQIMYKVTNEEHCCYGYVYRLSGRACKNRLGCKCTKAQEIEIKMLFDFYKRLYEKEEEVLFNAFVQKHRLFGVTPDDYEPQTMTPAEKFRLMTMMAGLRDETPLKQIEEKKE